MVSGNLFFTKPQAMGKLCIVHTILKFVVLDTLGELQQVVGGTNLTDCFLQTMCYYDLYSGQAEQVTAQAGQSQLNWGGIWRLICLILNTAGLTALFFFPPSSL